MNSARTMPSTDNSFFQIFRDKKFQRFILIFLGVFAVCYFGSLAVIGLAAPGGYYMPFVAKYFDFISFITYRLLDGTGFMLSLFGIETYRVPRFIIRIVHGTGVQIAYDCVGYGVMSFWTAFVIASQGRFWNKLGWLVFGLFLLWFINVCRISLFLVATNRKWGMPFGLDHHTLFTIAAYLAIFIMIYFFNKRQPASTRK